jgi:hypothetical protein
MDSRSIGVEHSDHCRANFFFDFVNNRVQTNIDFFLLWRHQPRVIPVAR